MAGRSNDTAKFLLPGDKVLWKGIKLTILEVCEDGSVIAWSPTMRVHVDSHTHFTKFKERNNGG